MTLDFPLPDIGEGIAEGEVVKWLVEPGQEVAEHQAVVEVMTDKATVEIPAPAAGKIVELLAKEGELVPVGQPIFRLEPSGEGTGGGGTAAPPASSAPSPSAEAAGSPPSATGTGRSGGAGGGGAVIEFALPDIGEGVAEGEIVKWLVEEGQRVEEHQSVVEVMTDKATVEIPAPAAGVIEKRLAAEGEVVAVGTVIFRLRTEAGAPVETPAPAMATAGAGSGAPATSASAPSRPAPSPKGGARVRAVPSARRVARELGIDLAEVPGTGRGGIVRRADVEAYAASRAAAAAPSVPAEAPAPAGAGAGAPSFAPPAGPREEVRTPFRGVRRKIAEAMTRSKFTAPHFTVVEEVDVTELLRVRASAKVLGEEQGVRVTLTPFIMKATALCLAKFPMLNGRLDEEAQELVHCRYVDLGIATDTPNGLIVPVVRDVEKKGVLQLAAELTDLVHRTREGKVRPEELKGSTFSITNAGNIGGILATPIINFPDIAILGVHRVMKRPGVVEGPEGERIEVRQYMNVSLSVDHRLADGADGARMLAYLRRLLENPGLLAL